MKKKVGAKTLVHPMPAVLVGTYKVDGEYGREIGLPRPYGRGAGAHIFQENRPPVFMEDLETAADFLQFLRRKA